MPSHPGAVFKCISTQHRRKRLALLGLHVGARTTIGRPDRSLSLTYGPFMSGDCDVLERICSRSSYRSIRDGWKIVHILLIDSGQVHKRCVSPVLYANAFNHFLLL